MSRQEMQTRRTDRGTISQAAGRALLTNDSPFAIKEAYVKLRTGLLFCMTKDGKNCKNGKNLLEYQKGNRYLTQSRSAVERWHRTFPSF